MSPTAFSISLEVDPSPSQKILFTLSKTTAATNQITWNLTFELQEGTPPATVVKLSVQVEEANKPQAAATFQADALDDNQQGQAQIAAAVASDPTATPGDQHAAVQQVMAVRQMSTTAAAS